MGCGATKVSPNVAEPNGSAAKAPTKQPPQEKETKTNGSDIQAATSMQPNQTETVDENLPKQTEEPKTTDQKTEEHKTTEQKKEIVSNVSADTKPDVKPEENRKPLTASDANDPGVKKERVKLPALNRPVAFEIDLPVRDEKKMKRKTTPTKFPSRLEKPPKLLNAEEVERKLAQAEERRAKHQRMRVNKAKNSSIARNKIKEMEDKKTAELRKLIAEKKITKGTNNAVLPPIKGTANSSEEDYSNDTPATSPSHAEETSASKATTDSPPVAAETQ